jgi:ubiquitin
MFKKKIFALASVTALTGLVASVAGAGCSSTTTTSASDDASVATDTGAKKPAVEAGPDPDAGPATCPTTAEITAASIQASFTWKSTGGAQSACVQKNLDDLAALFTKGGGSATYTDIKTTLGATCAACAFTKETATKWGLFLEDASGKTVYDNSHAACESIIDTQACAKADAEFNTCLDTACADCADQTTTDACYPKAVKGACKTVGAAASTACTADATACDSAVSVLAIVCGGGPDGGLDAGL